MLQVVRSERASSRLLSLGSHRLLKTAARTDILPGFAAFVEFSTAIVFQQRGPVRAVLNQQHEPARAVFLFPWMRTAHNRASGVKSAA
ncbi:hypothetical protein NDU88_002402 [Pleurodeles waltl]|uniref:Uncharacterized protein n=1 Tax=Pleurodeles waltl TaxID=8319 RepID=A0AAV7T1Y6_PLEWA|nr:hypothetical protein NDU88_002402 [Pleurodeles waltl]